MTISRKIAYILAGGSVATAVDARAFGLTWTPKSSTIVITGSSCAAGAVTGAIIGEGARKRDPYVDVAKNVALYGVGGCALGLLISYFVVDDSEDKQIYEENLSLRQQIRNKDAIIAQHGLAASSIGGPRSSMVPGGPPRKPAENEIDLDQPGGADSLLNIYGAVQVPYENIMKNAPKGLKIRNPRLTAFTVGYPGQSSKDVKENGWIAVSPRLGILPITGFLADTDLLPPDPRFGYLAETFPWVECLIINSLRARVRADKKVELKHAQCETLE